MSNNSILIYANDPKYILGGVEVFNNNLQKSFDRNNVNYIFFSKINYLKKNKFIREILSVFSLIFFKTKTNRNYKYLLIHQTSFLEIIFLPIIKIFFQEIRLVSHVGSSWFHIRNEFLLKLTNCVLNKFVKVLYIISNDQNEFFSHKSKVKIDSIVDYEFFSSKFIFHNFTDYILYLGRICKEKGIEDLIDAYYKLNIKTLPILKLVGPISNDFRKKLVNKINSYHSKFGKIEILDPVYDINGKLKLIDNCNFGVYPSYYDAFPLTPIEFFSRDKVCLTTSIAESKYFIEDEFLKFQPGDINTLTNKMEILISNEFSSIESEGFKATRKRAISIAKGETYKNFI